VKAPLKRVLWFALAALALAFAIEGGEFGTRDLIRNRRDNARLQHSLDSLTAVVKTLRIYKDSVEHNPAVQERIAREQFGMVRGTKELMYRFTDSVKK
jgi:cell division protein FtsB